MTKVLRFVEPTTEAFFGRKQGNAEAAGIGSLGYGPLDPNFGPALGVSMGIGKTDPISMSHTEGKNGNVGATTLRNLGLMAAVGAMTFLGACNYGGDHETSHPPMNPAMQGSPQESDHTNTDADDLQGSYGTGTGDAVVKDDNIQRTQGSPIPVPAAKDTTAAKH